MAATGFVHLKGEKARILGGPELWQFTYCNRVAATDSKLTENPDKVDCPACIKRINSFQGKRHG